MQHIVFSPFNIFGRNESEWLLPRMRMFKETCLPSMLAQTEQDFEWVIMVDSLSPFDFISELGSLLPSNGHIAFVPKHKLNQTHNGTKFPTGSGSQSVLWAPENKMPEILGSYLNQDWVSTTALSVDDSLAVDFMERLKEDSGHKEEMLQYSVGCQWMDCTASAKSGVPWTRKDGFYRVYNAKYALVYVEPVETFKSTFCFGSQGSHCEKRKIETDDPMWMWRVHGYGQNAGVNAHFKWMPNKKPYTREEAERRFGWR